MRILKFGGTSVGSPEAIQAVSNIVRQFKQNNQKIAVVVSAFSGVTNALIEISNKASEGEDSYELILEQLEKKHFDIINALIQVKNQSKLFARVKMMLNELEDVLHGVYLVRELSRRSSDLVLSFGERLSAYIVQEYFNQEGIDAEFADARQFIKTDTSFGNAKVDFDKTNPLIESYFAAHTALQVVTGFIGSNDKNQTTTLGRGGSDYTAAIVGAALNTEAIEIWTDVDGILTADPRIVKDAFTLPTVSYQEAMELSHFGAKVIYPPTLQPAFSRNIPIYIRNTFNPGFAGTLISHETGDIDYPIKGISSIADVALLNVQGSGLIGVAGVSGRLFTALAQHQINVILISQASSEHSICFAVEPKDAEYARALVEETFATEIAARKIDKVYVEYNLSVIAVIGENMRKSAGVSGKIFTALGRNGINVVASAQGSSELNISVVSSKKDLSKALNALHEAFFLSDTTTLHLYLVGPGLIGGTLLKQIKEHTAYLASNRNLRIKLVGLTNSKTMLINEAGIALENWQEAHKQGQPASLPEFVNTMKELNLPNSVLADCTAGPDVVSFYETILQSSIAIVTPNKIANSGPFSQYFNLKNTAARYNTRFLYEANVGAGLPILNTLRDLINSGDRIIKVEAILSGTLAYIFNTFSAEKSFSETVTEAKAKGYTEPDPRDDLNGKDMGRKMLILAREAGFLLEPEDIDIENILPQSCLEAATVNDFFEALEKENPYFEARRKKAADEGKVLRFIGQLEEGKATIRLEAVPTAHPFYFMSGSDNIIAFTTDRYKERPLVVKGPGAGAEVTAAGVFAEIVSLSK